MNSRWFNTLKYSICNQKLSIQLSDVHVLKKIQLSEVRNLYSKKLQFIEVHVLKKL